MSHPDLTILPKRITVGDHIHWREPAGLYPADEGWILHYSFTNRFAVFDSDHVAVGADHEISIDTAELEPGEYQYTKKAWDGGTDQHTIESGFIIVEPDLSADTTGIDRRSYAQTALDAIEAVLTGKASKDQTSYSLNGRSLSRYSPDELNAWRASLRVEVRDEKEKARRKAGKPSHRNIRIRMNGSV